VAWPDQADGYVANAGDRLVAFTVDVTEPVQQYGLLPSGGPTLSLSVDGSSQPLDVTDINNDVNQSNATDATGTESYLVSVPDDHNVELSMSDNGYTQSLSLWELTRTTQAPAVLYDAPTGSGLTDQLSLTKQVPIHDAAGRSYPSVVVVSSSSLDAFVPGGGAVAAPQGKAYLALQMSSGPLLDSQGNNGAYWFSEMTPIPGSGITLTVPNGRRYTAIRSDPQNQSNNPNLTTDDGLVDATYYFEVPSDTNHGVVAIGRTTTVGTLYSDWTQSNPQSLFVGGPVRFSIGFPAPVAPARQPTPPWVDEPVPTGGLPSKSSPTSGGLPVGIALVVLAAIVGALFVVRHRMRAVVPPDTEHVDEPSPQSVPVGPPVTFPVGTPRNDGRLHIDVIGPVLVAPTTRTPTEFARAFLSYLAVHGDRGRTPDDTQTALWPTVGTESDVTRKTFHNNVSDVRRLVGTEHLPENARGSGYRLTDATTDWQRFQQLVAEAGAATGPERRRLRREALSLVRGAPFESELSRWFQWADSEGVRTAITKAVVDVAIELHADCVHADDLDGAEWAIRQGLRCSPSELELWECLIDVVQARRTGSDEERFWRDATAALDPVLVESLRVRVRG
jgi:DNA-binding SARP family transcriptional activator